MSDRTEIDSALEREAQLADQRAQLNALRDRGAAAEDEYTKGVDAIRSELATVRARIARLLQRGERPTPKHPEVVEFPLAVAAPE